MKELFRVGAGGRGVNGASLVWRTAAAALLCSSVLLATTPPTTQDDEATRKLWDTAFIGSESKARPGRRQAQRRRYRVATPAVPTEEVADDTPIGVTIWRLRPASRAETSERLLIQEGAGAGSWIPERVAGSTRLAEGDRVRLSIEAARTGYLYVIDREEYADGTLGEPYLIFPTTRTLGGKNEVRAGRVVELPGQDDNPPFFTLKRSNSKQVGEVLSVIVTPEPIGGLEIGDSAQRLPAEQVAQWEKAWGAGVGRLEMEGAGQAWTREEKEAGADTTRSLTDAAPGPQMLFYRPGAKSADPLLVKVTLKYAGTRPPARRRPGRR